MKGQPKVQQKRRCANCGRDFKPVRPHQKFCKDKKTNCRWQYWNRNNPRITNAASVSAQ